MANDDGFPRDLVRVLAAWALVHEAADAAWKGAVARGGAATAPGEGGADGFVDALAALVDAEKARLVALLDAGAAPEPAVGAGSGDAAASALEALRFEVAEVRGRLESLQASVDALLARSGG
jgi:hypothetical protein